METPVILQKKQFVFLKAFFRQKEISSQIIFLSSLPILLLLTTIGICCIKATAYSTYLPFIALVGTVACVLWRGVGLSFGYCLIGLLLVCTFKHIPEREKLWQMGVLFGLAVDYFILILALDEIEDLLQQNTDKSIQYTQEIQNINGHLENVQAEHQKNVEILQGDIKQLSQELHHNALEKKQLQESMEWIQSEIEMLTSQKERFITREREANRALLDAQAASSHQMAEFKTACLHIQEKILLLKAVIQQNSKTELLCSQESIIAERETNRALLDASDGQMEELKTTSLQMQEKILSLKAAIQQNSKTELLCSQEAILRLQHLLRVPIKPQTTEKDDAYQNLERLQKQLRSQFNDKSLVLTETRKELFKLQGTLTAFEKENELHAVEKEFKEACLLEKALMEADQEINQLQEEVTFLEGLVSHALSR